MKYYLAIKKDLYEAISIMWEVFTMLSKTNKNL